MSRPLTLLDSFLSYRASPQRQKRLEDELSGKKRKAEGSVGPALDDAEIAALKRRRKRDEEIQNSINQHNVSFRVFLGVSCLLCSYNLLFMYMFFRIRSY